MIDTWTHNLSSVFTFIGFECILCVLSYMVLSVDSFASNVFPALFTLMISALLSLRG